MSTPKHHNTPNQGLPWGKLAVWNSLFFGLYFFRSVSLDIWLASRKTDVEFSELKFGETTLTSIRKILQRVPLGPDSTLYDLGCGRGRAAFLFHFLTGAKVVAVDLVGPFIMTGRRLAQWTGCEKQVLFCYENFLSTDFSDANVVYACALCFSEETRKNLADRFEGCRPGTHIVTVGWNPKAEGLEPLEEFRTAFSWGSAKVYIKRVRG